MKKQITILLIMVGMFLGVGGCVNPLAKESSAGLKYYSDSQQDLSNEYFDVQKLLSTGDQKLFEEQKPWILLHTASSIVLFPYEYLAFSPVPFNPTVP